MKAAQLKDTYNKLNARTKEAVTPDLKNHIIAALAYFYEGAQVGDNPLELIKPIDYDESGNDVYQITGIEMMFDSNQQGEMYFHQQVESDPSEMASNLLDILEVETLLSIMEAFEKQGFDYEEQFDFEK